MPHKHAKPVQLGRLQLSLPPSGRGAVPSRESPIDKGRDVDSTSTPQQSSDPVPTQRRRAYLKAYNERPEQRVKQREYRSRPDVIVRRREWAEKPGVVARNRQKAKERHRNRSRERIRAWRLKDKYGITLERYEEMLATQDGNCAICERPPMCRRLSVDHDHQTGRVRGLLCGHCNLMLGWVAGNPETLQRMIGYLRSEL